LTVSVANAWNKTADEGVVVLAKKHLSAEAKSLLNEYLGDTYGDDVMYLYNLERKKGAKHSKEIHYLHLDKDFQPLSVEGDDAYAALEKALAVVRAHKTHSAAEVKNALRYVVGLMLDIHNLSLIRIENVAHSQSDFKFRRHLSEYKPNVYKNYKWSTFFTAQSNSYAVFHADLWAEDMEVCHAKNKAEFEKGELRDWVASNGAMAAELLSEINPENIMTLRRYLELDYLNYDMMARAGYRLAKLLNETIK
jgi:hypothetical protein